MQGRPGGGTPPAGWDADAALLAAQQQAAALSPSPGQGWEGGLSRFQQRPGMPGMPPLSPAQPTAASGGGSGASPAAAAGAAMPAPASPMGQGELAVPGWQRCLLACFPKGC